MTTKKERTEAEPIAAAQNGALLDLSALDTGAKPGRIELKHPVTGEPIKASDQEGDILWIEVWSADSDVYRKAQSKVIREVADQRIREQRRSRNKQVEPDPQEHDANYAKILAGATHSWHDAIALDGKALLCTPGNAEILYRRIRWIFEQVSKGVGERENFIAAS
jgi:hypothetical protein